jgi:hypothetical protein
VCKLKLERDMFTSWTKQAALLKAVTTRDAAISEDAVDALIEHYVSWREECVAVRTAYQDWAEAGRAQREVAYVQYAAALNREEQAAHRYAQQVGWVARPHA